MASTTLLEIRLRQEEAARRALPAWTEMAKAMAEMQRAAAERLAEILRERTDDGET